MDRVRVAPGFERLVAPCPHRGERGERAEV